MGIADDAALSTAEGNIHHGAFPGHPGGQRADLVQGHVGREADAAFGRPPRQGMLHAIAGEDLDAAVVEQHRNVNGELLGSGAQYLAHAVIQLEAHGGLVEPRLGGDPGILFILERNGNGQGVLGHGSCLR